MDLEALSAEYWEGLGGAITAVRQLLSDPDGGAHLVRVSFACDSFDDPDPAARLHFEIECTGVREMNLHGGPVDAIEFVSEHPLLLEYNAPHEYLHFSSAPARPEEVVGRLYLAHHEVIGDWRPLSRVLNPSIGQGMTLPTLLGGGRGMLARGPVPVVSALAVAVAPYMNVYRNPSYDPSGSCRVLLFDDAYIVCDAAEVVSTETANVLIRANRFADGAEHGSGSEDS
jgi:hypothetical protein